ncbi:hypothetical protein BU16DRAFT_373909 [Lophium mytilinum]|uniref:Secreted protein n=1 Tax=Lophium mytilinum TaxID=390894 RepID=A0A6A6QYZ0_9PEZI|nr:hypothetical protein BU16DRAFT_373909 [Lophium mytilinum]
MRLVQAQYRVFILLRLCYCALSQLRSECRTGAGRGGLGDTVQRCEGLNRPCHTTIGWTIANACTCGTVVSAPDAIVRWMNRTGGTVS